jgi:hypothetical protein
MCRLCADLDEKIERCRRLLAMVTDPLTTDGISGLLKTYEAERERLHPPAHRLSYE